MYRTALDRNWPGRGTVEEREREFRPTDGGDLGEDLAGRLDDANRIVFEISAKHRDLPFHHDHRVDGQNGERREHEDRDQLRR